MKWAVVDFCLEPEVFIFSSEEDAWLYVVNVLLENYLEDKDIDRKVTRLIIDGKNEEALKLWNENTPEDQRLHVMPADDDEKVTKEQVEKRIELAKKDLFACGWCGWHEPPVDDLWEGQDYPRCPNCQGC